MCTIDVFRFSLAPSRSNSLLRNFPDFEQKETQNSGFWEFYGKAAYGIAAGLELDIQAPTPGKKPPSMTMGPSEI